MGGYMGGWVDGWVNMWVNGWGHVISIKNQINLELIEIIQFCLKISDLLKTPSPMGGCIDGWVDGWVNMWVNGGSFLDIFT